MTLFAEFMALMAGVTHARPLGHPQCPRLHQNSAQGFQALLEAPGTRPLATFDNRLTWDNPTPMFDNRRGSPVSGFRAPR